MPRRARNAVGVHVSVAGGLPRCLPYVDELGAEVVQLFLSSPRAWATPDLSAATAADARFGADCASRCVLVYVHAPYLVNFGSPAAETLQRSARALTFSLRRGASIGAAGVVMHAGSAVLGNDRDVALKQVREQLLPVLDAVPGGPPLLVEPTAGGGAALASDADSLGAYLDALGRDERVGVCLDTCHVHASGADLSTTAGFGAALRAYARAAGPGGIGLVHVNDSRDPAGSKRDRHAALGTGTIGSAAFAALFTSRAVRGVPLVAESPPHDHAADLAVLRDLRDRHAT